MVEANGSTLDFFPAAHSIGEGGYLLLEAVPEPGYHFVGWTGDLASTENPARLKVSENTEIMAHFAAGTRQFLSEDGNLDVVIPEWTNARNDRGDLLTSMEFTTVEAPPPPDDTGIVGPVYNLTPDGATFDKLVTITWKYDPNEIPEGVAEADLTVSCYQEDSGEWTPLVSIVDSETDTIKTFVDHFSVFAVTFPIPPPPPPVPAAFSAGSLKVTPAEVEIGETVGISVLLHNTGEESGSYPLALRINGTAAETKEITLAGGESKTVVFTTAMEEAGDYPVAVDGLSDSFTVNQAPFSLPFGWNMLVPIGVGVFLATFIPVRMRRRRGRSTGREDV
jgi:hypothetical protein